MLKEIESLGRSHISVGEALQVTPDVGKRRTFFKGNGHSFKYRKVCHLDFLLIDTGGEHRSHRQKPQRG